MPREILTRDEIRTILESARVVAVLGAHVDPSRPAAYVPDYLHAQGYRMLPVNPALAGKERWGEVFRASLGELEQPVDVVDVFRRSELLPGHLGEILAMRPAPQVVWLQSGIRHPEFAQALVGAGIDVVQDRCMLAEHRALGIAPCR